MRNRTIVALAALVVLFVVLVEAAAASPRARQVWCHGAASWASARSHVGELVRIKARVVRSYYARSSTGSPTFIDLGHAYPNGNRLTLVIWSEDRANFPRAPETMFRAGTMICAQGRVSVYRGVPEIEVSLWDAASRLVSF